MRIPFLAEPAAEQYRSQGTKPTMGAQHVQGKADDRDRLAEFKAETYDKGGFVETLNNADVADDEFEALRQYIPQGVSGEPVPFEENVRWLKGIAEADKGKAGAAAKKMLAPLQYYLGDDEMYGAPEQAP
jgi:hypothetical protein